MIHKKFGFYQYKAESNLFKNNKYNAFNEWTYMEIYQYLKTPNNISDDTKACVKNF